MAQRVKTDNEIIAERAGLNIQFPGLSEYSEKYTNSIAQSGVNKLSSKYSHSINSDLVNIHRVRQARYDNQKNFGITGNSENRTRYVQHDPSEYIKNKIIRSDFVECNIKSLPFSGTTEYNDKFKSNNGVPGFYKNVSFSLNPSLDLASASQGRPYADQGSTNRSANPTTQYHDIHDWPKREKRELFEWIR